MPTLYSRVRNRALPLALRFGFPLTRRPDLTRLGTQYGGRVIPSTMPRADWICYCGGVGEDASFDLELIERYQCNVFSFDFTPRAIAFAEPIAANNSHFNFSPFGLWSADTDLEFWAPANPAHVSYSATNLQGTDQSIIAPVRSLSSVMAELGHDHIDLLKIDIEGAEFEVLRSMLDDSRIRPSVLCVEFDQPVPVAQVHRAVRQLLHKDYRLVAIDGWNYTFVFPDRPLKT